MRSCMNFCFSGNSNLIRCSSGRVSLSKMRSVSESHEKLWCDLFADPTKWWDNRSEKPSARFPDFKHKQTGEGLWLIDGRNPPGVILEIASIAPGLSICSLPKRLLRYNKAGRYEKTMEHFQLMQEDGVILDGHVFVHVLKACAALQDLEQGRRVHQLILETGCELNLFVGSSLINMYAKCGKIDEAWRVFNEMPKRNVVAWNNLILGCVKCREYSKALELYREMQQQGVQPDNVTFVGLLKACASTAGLAEGRLVHKQILRSDCESDVFVRNSLIDMYGKCGSVDEAWSVFNKMPIKDVVGWNAMISGFVKCGQGRKALELFPQMREKGVEPNSVTFVGLLNSCASLEAIEEGMQIHKKIIRIGLESDVYVSCSLVDMYAKCGNIDEAWRVFSKIPARNVIAWNSMIIGCVKCGEPLKAIELFHQMRLEGFHPDQVTFVGLLNACASIGAIKEGKLIHELIGQSCCEFSVNLCNSLINMYANCGSGEEAWEVFTKMPTRDVVGWNAMILGFVKSGQGQKALEVFEQMQLDAVYPSAVTFVGLLNACSSISALEKGKIVHKQIILSGLELDVYIGSSLVDMYAKCGCIDDAWKVFNKMPTKDVVVWNAMILGFVKCEHGEKALSLFEQMQKEGVKPNSVTFVELLNACASIGGLEKGRHVHEQIRLSGFESNLYVVSSLIDMYSKCCSIEEAWSVFKKMPKRNAVVWTAMIVGCGRCGQGQKSLQLFDKMLQEGVKPDPITFVGLVNACASVGALEAGKRVHEQILQSGCEMDVYVGNSLVDMYVKCGSINKAWRVLNNMPKQDCVGWNALILGCVRNGQGHRALEFFQSMQENNIEPDSFTFVGLLNSCASIGTLEEGRHIHELIIQTGCELDGSVGNSLVDMYAKCGSLDEACRVFNEISTPGVVGWNVMITGYAMHGLAKEALACFEQMLLSGSEADKVTFTCLLSACSHGGLVQEGIFYLDCMWPIYGVQQTQEHLTCMVDILGRAGHLDTAEEMLKTMPLEPTAAMWMSLLGACRIHGNVKMGQRATERFLKVDPTSAAGYVLLSNIYADASYCINKPMIQEETLNNCVVKLPERTWIEVHDKVHSFVANDCQHPQRQQIGQTLKELSENMKEEGYVPDKRFALHDAEGEIFQHHFCGHSERLAIAFGLINTPACSPLRIVKNLLMCIDCHTATKFISKKLGRAITVRDSNCFHYVKDGLCSCSDY